MGDRQSAERACREPNPIIDGRKANVNLAILGAKPRGNVPTGMLSFCFRFRLLFFCVVAKNFDWRIFGDAANFVQK